MTTTGSPSGARTRRRSGPSTNGCSTAGTAETVRRSRRPFSQDAHFVAFDGSVLHGRKQIAETHRVLFDKWLAGTRLTDEQHRRTFSRSRCRGALRGRRDDHARQIRSIARTRLHPDPGGQARWEWLVTRVVPEHPDPTDRQPSGRGHALARAGRAVAGVLPADPDDASHPSPSPLGRERAGLSEVPARNVCQGDRFMIMRHETGYGDKNGAAT